MKHAFEALPQTVLGTPVGRMVFRVLQRNVMNKGNNRKGGKK
jgi:hypothetical protein